MRFKAFFIYIALGAAFLGVSLWVILSGGRNAKAIRTKYKLGGALLTAWAMMSAGTCNGPVPTVSCYDPIPPEVMCYDVAIIQNDIHLESNTLKRGVQILIEVQNPVSEVFIVRIQGKDGSGTLQEERISLQEGYKLFFTPSSTLPAGEAVLAVSAVPPGENPDPAEEEVFRTDITLE